MASYMIRNIVSFRRITWSEHVIILDAFLFGPYVLIMYRVWILEHPLSNITATPTNKLTRTILHLFLYTTEGRSSETSYMFFNAIVYFKLFLVYCRYTFAGVSILFVSSNFVLEIMDLALDYLRCCNFSLWYMNAVNIVWFSKADNRSLRSCSSHFVDLLCGFRSFLNSRHISNDLLWTYCVNISTNNSISCSCDNIMIIPIALHMHLNNSSSTFRSLMTVAILLYIPYFVSSYIQISSYDKHSFRFRSKRQR